MVRQALLCMRPAEALSGERAGRGREERVCRGERHGRRGARHRARDDDDDGGRAAASAGHGGRARMGMHTGVTADELERARMARGGIRMIRRGHEAGGPRVAIGVIDGAGCRGEGCDVELRSRE